MNLFIEAGAGSGKTHSLILRILALFASGLAVPSGIAAITFTRKAAAELRERLQETLEEAAVKELDPVRQDRLQKAADSLGEAFLGTIHSFCARLLREHPFEAGLDPDFIELEEDEAERFDEESWELYLVKLQSEAPELPEKLELMGLSATDLRRFFQRLAEFSEVEPVVSMQTAPELEPTHSAALAFFESLGRLFPQQRPENGWDSLQSAVIKGRQRLTVSGSGDHRRLREVLESVEKAEVTLNRWADKACGQQARDILNEFIRAYGSPWLKAWREYCHGQATQWVAPAVAFAAERRRLGARVGFSDLLLGVTKLLREHPRVRRRLGERITHLFVDEFQDTDPVQAEMMFLLAGEPVEERNWRKVTPRPGSLFVVGDPKQSIYRFRRADISIYQEAKELIRASGGEVLRLTSNFRSNPLVCQWISEAFQSILPAGENSYQAAYAPLLSTQSQPSGEALAGVWKISLPKVDRNKKDLIIAMDAQRIAGWIGMACRQGLLIPQKNGAAAPAKPGDFMILVPYKANMEIYAHALESVGIPVEISGGNALGNSPYLRGFLAICDALADPEDPVKLLACLRGPFFGLSDNQLYAYKVAGGRFSFLFPGNTDDEVCRTLQRIFSYWQLLRTRPILTALEEILEELGLWPLAACDIHGSREVGAIAAALERLRATQDGTGGGFQTMVERLTKRIMAGEADGLPMRPTDNRGVRLMNLHKAKGLEAPVVFLANPTRRTEHHPECHVERHGTRPQGYFLLQSEKGFAKNRLGQPPKWDDAQAEEELFQEAEHNRLLYVAATRAKHALIISRYPGQPEGDFWAELHNAVADLPEIPAILGESIPPKEISIDPTEIVMEISRSKDQIDACANPGYQAMAVTELNRSGNDSHHGEAAAAGEIVPEDMPLAMDGETNEESPESGTSGSTWGTAVHRMLAITAIGLEPAWWETTGRRILSEEGLSLGLIDPLLETTRRLWASPFGQRVKASRQILCEVPFGLGVSRKDLGLADDSGPEKILLEGVIDLAFLEDEGWVIADYKTDIGAENRREALTAYYAPQLTQYIRFFHEKLGLPVREGVLVFLRTMETVRIMPQDTWEPLND